MRPSVINEYSIYCYSVNADTFSSYNVLRRCDPLCDPEMGCWGPGPTQCVISCGKVRGFFPTINATDKLCVQCHPECLSCHGPEATDCDRCFTNFKVRYSNK